MKNKKPKELTQEELWELIKSLEGFIFPDDLIDKLQQEIDNSTPNQIEIPF